ncbi:MAG: chemotaxis protein CheW [Deltaproteobacteria bacterium]|nr:chemotaxis protein CheW [Deltaproteobacteria bacterium]
MQQLILFKVSDNLFAIDQKFVKKNYQKEELFSERASKAKKVKIKLDGRDVPLYDLPAMFGGSDDETGKSNGEAMLVKDKEGHMVLLAHQIEGAVEIEKEFIKDLSPVFGKRSCMYFSTVTIKDNLPVLILNPSGIRIDKNLGN